MKRIAIKVHLWLGLTLGLLWAVQGLTGSALVFHREIDRWSHPERSGTPGPMISLDRLIAAAAAETGATPKRISVVDDKPDLVAADYDSVTGEQRQLFLDAASGRVLGARPAMPSNPGDGATSRFLYNLHERLLTDETGELFIGISGIVLMTSLATGLWIGWPRLWRGVMRVQAWRSWPQKLYGWHRLVGLASGVALLIITLTGIYMIFAQPIRGAIAMVAPHSLPFKPQPYIGVTPKWAPAQPALEAAQALFPEGRFVRASLPTTKSAAYVVRLLQPGEPRLWAGSTSVTIDGLTGRVLHVYDPLTAPLSNRMLDAAFSIHNGEIAGLAGRALVMLAGLSLPMFYVTGLWLWLTRQRRSTKPAFTG